MDKHTKNKEMNARQTRDDFQRQWERRKHSWQEVAEHSVPDDGTVIRLADLARLQTPAEEENAVSIQRKPFRRIIPYAAAASLLIGVTAIGLTRHKETTTQQPVVSPTDVDGQTVLFMCNNGCSAHDVIIAVNDVIKK